VEQPRRSAILIVPFALLLVCRLGIFGAQVNESAGDDGVLKMTIEAIAYVIAGIIVLVRFDQVRPLLWRLTPFFLYALYASLTSVWSSYPASSLLRVGHMLGLSVVAICAAIWAQRKRSSWFSFNMGFMLLVLILSLLCVRFFPARGVVNYEAVIESGGGTRWLGITGHPNILGAVGMVGIWVALYGLFIEPSRWSRFFSVLTIVLSLVAFYGSDSRSSMGSAVFLVSIFYLVAGAQPVGLQSFLKRLIVVTALVGVGLSIVYLLSPDAMYAYLLPSSRVGGGDALSSRPLIWAYGLEALVERPTGWSYDLLQTYNEAHGGAALIAHFHNGYLDVAVKGGYIAEALLLVILARMAWAIGRLRKIDYAMFSLYVPFFIANLIYNVVEAGFDRESLTWPMMIIVWASAEAALIQHDRSGITTPRKVRPSMRGEVHG